MLLILALLNVFLLVVVLSDEAAARRGERETAASVTALLEENGIAVADGAVRIAKAPAPAALTREILQENERVRKLIGDYTPEDAGGNIIYYRGEKGQALLRGSGETDVVLFDAFPLRGGHARSAARLLRAVNIAAAPADESGAAFYCCFDGVPVYNAVLRFTFSESYITMVTGTRLFDGVTRLPDDGAMDSVSALLRFVEIVRSEGYICSRLESVEPGYSMDVTRSGAAELIPVWRIGTDTGALLIDAATGQAIR